MLAESRSPYRDSYKPPFRAVALIVLAALAAGGYCICNAVDDPILRNMANSRCPVGDGQDKIEWAWKPQVSTNGRYLEMRGKTKDNAQIHDVRVVSDVGYWSAFSLVEIKSGDQEPVLLAGVWPQSLKSLFEGAEEGRMFAEADEYDVSSTEFDIKVRLSPEVERALDNDLKVAVLVGAEQDPTSGVAILGAECIER